jgi:hypothetical protein
VAAEGGGARLEVRRAAAGWKAGPTVAAGKLGGGDGGPRLAAFDLDNDGHRDLLAYGSTGARFFRGAGDGTFTDATAEMGLAKAGATAAAAVDLDVEGDLDLALAGGASGAGEVWRNNLAGALEAVGDRMLPALAAAEARDLVASDLDRDGDLDLLRVAPDGLLWLDNLRQGELADRTARGGLAKAGGGRAAVAADLDADGFPDLVVAGDGVSFWRNRQGAFRAWDVVAGLPDGPAWTDAVAFDADNDGRLDLALAGDPGAGGGAGVAVAGQRGGARFGPIRVTGGPASATAVAAADLDGDGDLDLLAADWAGSSVAWHENDGSGGGWTAHTLTTAAGGAVAAVAADLDRDGDLDVLSASWLDDEVDWFANRGTKIFTSGFDSELDPPDANLGCWSSDVP